MPAIWTFGINCVSIYVLNSCKVIRANRIPAFNTRNNFVFAFCFSVFNYEYLSLSCILHICVSKNLASAKYLRFPLKMNIIYLNAHIFVHLLLELLFEFYLKCLNKNEYTIGQYRQGNNKKSISRAECFN